MNESSAKNNTKIEHIRSFLQCVIKAELKWEVEILTSLDTGVTHHSLLNGSEFLFNYQNKFALSKSSQIKNWFIREDYQFQLMRFIKQTLKVNSRDSQTGPKTIYRFILNCDKSQVEMVCVVSSSLELEIQTILQQFAG